MSDDFGTMEILGLSELEDKLELLTTKLVGKSLDKALNYAVAPMVKEAKQLAPKSEKEYRRYMSGGQGEATQVKTKRGKMRRGKSKRAKRGEGKFVMQKPGTLRRSIKRLKITKLEEFKKNGTAVGIFVSNRKSDLPPYYWYFIEHGTSKMPASPFMRPAFDHNVEEAANRFGVKLNENIDEYLEQS